MTQRSNFQEQIRRPEDKWSCKRSSDTLAYYKYKNKFHQIGHCLRMGQGQLRVIIYINFVELEYIMLLAKFHDHRIFSSVGRDFGSFYLIWAWRPSWSCDLDHLYNFLSIFQRRLHMKFGFVWPGGFREEDF